MATSSFRTLVPTTYPSLFFGPATLTVANYAVSSLLVSTVFSVTFASTNPASATLQINSGTIKPLVNPYGVALPAGTIVAGSVMSVVDSGSSYVVTALGVYASQEVLVTAGGTSDAITVSLVPAPTVLTPISPILVRATLANTTTSPTLAVNGIAAKTIVKGSNLPLTPGDIAGVGHMLEFQYDLVSDRMVLQNPATGINPAIRQNSQAGIYAIVLDDAYRHILHPSIDTTARTYTVPANASVAFPIGAWFYIVNQNAAGVITIAITTDTMRLAGPGTTGSRTLAANGICMLLKLTATEWIISGTGLT